ncbi:MAG TPA: YciI family protein [Halanaerobiales bacterium]|nr:YciI family protein [Halanaerobiales bacterium]
MEENIFVRLDEKVTDKRISKEIFNNHLKYIENLQETKLLMAGGFEDKDGGMVVLKAANYAEAIELCSNDPIIKQGFYKFKLYNWDIKYKSNIEEVFSSG